MAEYATLFRPTSLITSSWPDLIPPFIRSGRFLVYDSDKPPRFGDAPNKRMIEKSAATSMHCLLCSDSFLTIVLSGLCGTGPFRPKRDQASFPKGTGGWAVSNKPRPIEFMLRGYSVHDMIEILAHWDQFTEAEKAELGFTDSPRTRSSASPGQSRLN